MTSFQITIRAGFFSIYFSCQYSTFLLHDQYIWNGNGSFFSYSMVNLILLYFSDIFFCPCCERLSRLWIILYFLAGFLKTFVPFKDLRPQRHIFTINQFKTLSWGFPQLRQRLQVNSLSILELLTVF